MLRVWTVMVGSLLANGNVLAGMPSALPEDLKTLVRVADSSVGRYQAISFFLMAILVSTVAVQYLWNLLARDSSWLPPLTFTKAFAIVMLWGALFVVVLTMISGARELMTPGAWEKNGVTYQLQEDG